MKNLGKGVAIALSICLLFQPVLANEVVPEPAPIEEAPILEPAPLEEAPIILEPAPEPLPEPVEPAPKPLPPEPVEIEEEPVIEEIPPVEEVPIPSSNLEYVPGEIIVKFKESSINLEKKSGEAKAETFAESQGLELGESIEPANIAIFETDADPFAEAARLQEDPRVEFAEPNYIQRIGAIDADDTDRALLWALENTGQTAGIGIDTMSGTNDADMDIPEAWSQSRGAGVIVAVIDTGIDYDHPDLAANMWNGSDCVDEGGHELGDCIHGYDFDTDGDGDEDVDDKDPAPEHEHGTHVAGIIGASMNNATGTIGVAPEVKLMALRTDFEYNNETVLSTAAIVRAIDFATQNDAKIINASFGSYAFSTSTYQAIERFGNAGGIFIAAAGNSSTTLPFYPAAFDLPNVISVGATDQNDVIASFSNYSTTTVDIAAPGTNIYSTVIGSSYDYRSGTSMAAPHISGLAALLLANEPGLSVSDLKSAILTSGDTIPDLASTTVTGKRANASTTLDSLANATSSTLTVSLSIVNDSGRSATTSDVTFSVNGGSSQAFESNNENALTVLPGRYVTVTGSSLSDYTPSSNCANITLAAGATVPCTLTYNDNPIISSGGGGGGGGGSAKKQKTVEKKKIVKKEIKKKETKKRKTTKKSVPKPPVSPEMPRVVSAAPLSYTAYTFSIDRSVGAQGSDVTELQKVLATKGFLFVAPTGYFGPLTQSALRQFQMANGIVPAFGYFGPITRARLNL
ncbi:MAG TPA: S8 family serine peptidase [Candidatus Paceibacterota bacterium]